MLRCYKPLSILKVNFFKSTFGGIRAGTNTLESFANILNCKLMLVPFTYVDVPVGTNPRRECTWAPIVKKFEKKLSSWKHKLLSLAGRVFLINFVLTSLPLFFLQRDFLWESMDGGKKIERNGNGFCSIEKIVRLQRDFLWENVTGGRKIAMRNNLVKEMGIWGEEEWKWEPRWRKELFVWEQQQLQQLQRALSQVCIRKTGLDSWIWATDPSSTFTVKLAYSDLHNLRFPREVDETSDNVWKLQIPRKVTRTMKHGHAAEVLRPASEVHQTGKWVQLWCDAVFVASAVTGHEMNASSPSQAKEQDDDTKPLWTYVTKIKSVGGGGNYEIKCNICDFTFNRSYTRVRAHLLKMTGKGVRFCQKVTIAKLIDLKKIDNEATLRVEKTKTKSVSLPPVSTQHQMDTNTSGIDPKKRKTSTVENAFNLQARETLDHEITKMFYSLGLPFHLARNPHYRKAFAYAANNQISGYQPPGYNKLRTTLLQNKRRHVENLLQPIKNAWSQKGVSTVSDGWSDPQRRSLINFMVVTESGPMFLKAIDCSNEIKDKDFIAKLMREVIMEVGHSNVVQIVTDNAVVCKAADDAMFVKNFVMSHSMRLSIFSSLKLLSIAPTRFASTIVMLKRFKQLKKGLQEIVISDQWSSYKEDDVSKAKLVKDTLLDDKWWDKVDYILSFTSPIYDVLRRTDMDASYLHLVYEMWDSMIEKVKNAIYQYERKEESERSTFYEVVHSILIDRWTKSSTPLHCLAHSLNPRYYSQEWLSEDSNRVPPHQDMELTRERLKCFKRFFLDVDVRRKVNIEFANFSDGREGFDDLDSLNDRGQMDPKAWWLVHGVNAPIL
ncbi:hypothetical protein AAZX31_14G119300 [Glycine max]